MEQLSSPLWHAEGTFEPAQLTGHLWDPGSNAGTFTAVPRVEK